MKGIDTNAVVRLIVKDDSKQAQLAYKYVKANAPCFISTIVLCEVVWVLQSVYEYHKTEIVSAIETLLKTIQFQHEAPDLIWKALLNFRDNNVDFSDAIIATTAQLHQCETVGTFDKKASRISGFEIIK